MSRRGGFGHDVNNWNKTFNNKAGRRPPGLRGRDIGLYYKNLQKHAQPGKKTARDIIVHLTIPPAVLTSLENNIKSIRKLAKECNIPILKLYGLNLNKNKMDAMLTNEKPIKIDTVTGPSTSTFIKTEESCKAIEGQYETMVFKSEDVNEYKVEDNFKKPEFMPNVNAKQIIASVDMKEEPMDVAYIKTEDTDTNERLLSLRGAGDFKYGYQDIITGLFDEKLDECLGKGVAITAKSAATEDLNIALYHDYEIMLDRSDYKKIEQFRKTLPAYKKSKDILNVIDNNQMIVISGETGCGKSTQVPQLILDDAIINKRGGYVKILVTQPRRIAASSLAMRVAQERAEHIGNAVGYAVRLEKVDARDRGSIMFCTTGILLASLEVDQGLTNYTHIILDEVHERDCDIDLAMFMLKKVLHKRKDLKLILMSATIDADALSTYFNNCPMLHIEGLAYPVKDIYMEEILGMTGYKLPTIDMDQKNIKPWHRHKKKKIAEDMEKDIQYKAEIAPWLESIKKTIKYDTYKTLQDQRIEELNIDLIYDLIEYVCKGPKGAILVFLPGIADISKLLTQIQKSNYFPTSRYQIYPLHSKLPSLQQHQIFERPPENVRKIIIATNIAETSITIDDIVYVIDCGRMKHSGLIVEGNIATLQTEWISQTNLRQRRGRAGRCQPGICYHLMTSYRASKLDERPLPEIQRNPLLESVLALKRLRLGKAAEAFPLMASPPADRTVELAVKHLQQCGALDHEEKLTPMGWHLARLPVHPAAGKLLLLGALFGCLDRAASVAAVWGFKDPFQLVIGKEDEVDAAKKSFALGEGSDHVAISEAIIQWEAIPSQSQKRSFAYTNFLAHNTLELLSDMKKQFGNNLKQMGFLPSGDILSQWENRNKDNMSLFKAVIAASLYPNIATAKWANKNARNPNKVIRVKARTPEDGFIYIHPSSVMSVKKPKRGYPSAPACNNPGASWLVYWTKQLSSELYLLEITLVHSLPLLFFGELSVTEAEKPDECYITITSVKVLCKRRTAELLFEMRSLLDQVLAAKIGVSSTHAIIKNPFEDQVLKAVKELITAEDERAEYLNEEEDSESDNSEFESNTSWRR